MIEIASVLIGVVIVVFEGLLRGVVVMIIKGLLITVFSSFNADSSF